VLACVGRAPCRATHLGAKLGAIPCGPHRTGVDAGGHGTLSFQALWTLLDTRGHGLEIYGSGGWVFESPRARYRKPLQ